MTFPIPQSLKEYYGDRAVRSAVDALAEKLKGIDMPEVGWEEGRNYNQALLMAAQVRADDDGRSDALGVCLSRSATRARLGLTVYRYKQGEEYDDFRAAAAVNGWCVKNNEKGGYNYVANQSVDLAAFLGDAGPALDRFRRDARAMVDALEQD